jgi:hypothetical protein
LLPLHAFARVSLGATDRMIPAELAALDAVSIE